MTANAFHEDRLRCLDAGMDDFISKPVSPEVLYSVLLKWLEPPQPSQQKNPDRPAARTAAVCTAGGQSAPL